MGLGGCATLASIGVGAPTSTNPWLAAGRAHARRSRHGSRVPVRRVCPWDLRAANRRVQGPARRDTPRPSRILAGFPDDQGAAGHTAGHATLAGLRIAKEHGWTPESGD